MVLQAAIVARAAPEPLREQIGSFRELAFRASKLLGELDAYRHNVRFPRQPVKLAEVVQRVVKNHDGGADIRCDVDGLPLSILGNEADVARLTGLLVRAAQAAGAPVRVGLKETGDRVVLRVEDGGPDVEPGRLCELFEPFAVVRQGQNSLERSACQTIARRLEAKLRASPREGGGVVVSVEFKPATN
jgi:C4-dicarboxylate-specific signal transduction histidine kinase